MVLITSSTDNITLKIDPAVVLATRKYVDDKVLELKVYVDDLMAKHLAANDPHTQYAPKPARHSPARQKRRRQRQAIIPRSLQPRPLCRRQLPRLLIPHRGRWIR
jgi:hypothetical protein